MPLTKSIAKMARQTLILAVILAWASTAHATAFMEVVWTATTSTNPLALASLGTNTIVAAPGDEITAELRVVTDALGLSVAFLSIAYDEDLKDELNVVGFLAADSLSGFFNRRVYPPYHCQDPGSLADRYQRRFA